MNKLNEIFDRIYCINLDSRTDRWERSTEIFNNMNLEVTRHSANDGSAHNSESRVNRGEVGCLWSHREILQQAEDENLGPILILEDDIEFVRGFDHLFEKYWERTPQDWDMLYLGANNQGELKPVSENVYKATKLLTTSSYAVTPGTRMPLIRAINSMDVPVDDIFTRIQPNINCYLYVPYLTWQREGYSDVRGGFRNYDRVLKKYSNDK